MIRLDGTTALIALAPGVLACLLATACGGRASQGSGEPPSGAGDPALWSETWVAETRGLDPEELSWRGLAVPGVGMPQVVATPSGFFALSSREVGPGYPAPPGWESVLYVSRDGMRQTRPTCGPLSLHRRTSHGKMGSLRT